jgi:hypothetical protein
MMVTVPEDAGARFIRWYVEGLMLLIVSRLGSQCLRVKFPPCIV